MSRKDIGKIVELMKNDFKSVFANPIVTLLIVAIIILPSLYALINVEACWDPYSNTDEVDFAIANLDNGTSFQGLQLNIGNELVKELKNNGKFDWKFVTEDELRDGVNKGDYYAGIIIPKNLSENIVSITGDNPKQAKLEYVVNIKANPVASRLTDAGANAIYTSLNAKIVDPREKCCRYTDDEIDVCNIPDCVCRVFEDRFVNCRDDQRKVYVSLGLFTIIRLERNVQLLIPAYDFCIPEKECVASSPDDPCEIFANISFPVDEFFPPVEDCMVPDESDCCCEE